MSAAGFDPVEFLARAVPVASNEDVGEMRALLVETIEEHGVEARVDDAGNTLATRGPGDGAGAEPTDAGPGDERTGAGPGNERTGAGPGGNPDATHVVLNTHVDTVSPHVPFERSEGVIRGRGACDAKGPLAALLAAFLAVDPAEVGDPGGGGRVTLAVTPDEETLSTGAAALSLDGDAYVVGEPTGLAVCNAAKGRFQGTITLRGESAHAAEPDSGANAVAAAGDALRTLRGFDADREPHPDLGAPTLTPTVIEGGTATNQVAAECRVTVDRRSVPPETAAGFRAALEERVRAAVPAGVEASFALTDRPSPFLEAFATPADHPLVRTLAAAAREAAAGVGRGTGDGDGDGNRNRDGGDGDGDGNRNRDGGDEGPGTVRPFAAATEASYFAPAPTVVFGPGVLADDEGPVAHADREYVRTAEVRAAADALTRALRALIAGRRGRSGP